MTIPFTAEELLIRINAALGRTPAPVPGTPADVQGSVMAPAPAALPPEEELISPAPVLPADDHGLDQEPEPEPEPEPAKAVELLVLPTDEEFIRRAYQLLLGREADAQGFASHLAALRLGLLARLELLRVLCNSPEGRQRRVNIVWPPAARGGGWAWVFSFPLLRRVRAAWRFSQLPDLLAGIAAHQEARQVALESADREQRQAIEALMARTGQLEARTGQLETVNEALCRDIRSAMAEYRALLLGYISCPVSPGPARVSPGTREEESGSCFPPALYAGFEEQFRGSMAQVRASLQLYLPLVREVARLLPGLPVIDLGCGRGEWLDLLRDEKLPAQGVELNPVFVEDLAQRGLAVTRATAHAALAALPTGKAAVVTAFHLIEHLPPDSWVPLLDEIRRILAPGGMVILETPNPRNILVGAGDFYRDPGHRAPVFPDTLCYLGRARGFAESTLWFFDPSRQHLLPADEWCFAALEDYLRVSRDYVWIGRQPR